MDEQFLAVKDLEEKYPGYAFRYTSPQAAVRHGIKLKPGGDASDGLGSELTGNRLAMCGASPVWFSGRGWLGTGSQEEYDRNDQLRLCKRCLIKMDGGSFGKGLFDKQK